MVTDVEARLASGLARLGVAAEPAATGRLLAYLRLLQAWNRAYNLTRITDLDDMAVRHLLDSASVLPFVQGPRVLDAGTGGGLPGVVLAVLRPDWHLTLLDAVQKKVSFLRQVAIELPLANITPVHARLEQFEGAFDTIVSRALGPLGEFATLCGPLLAPGGRLLAMKGRRPDDELAALPAGWEVTAIAPLAVPGLDAERHVIVLER